MLLIAFLFKILKEITNRQLHLNEIIVAPLQC